MTVPLSSNLSARTLKLAMTLLVRNEDDILEDNIRYHARLGVDLFIIMDNLSSDTTPHILRRLAREFPIIYHSQTNDEYRQAEWVTAMAREASAEPHCADWVINNDADEFWVFPNDSIKEYLLSLPPQICVIQAKRLNALNTGGGGKNPISSTSHPRKSLFFDLDSRNCLGNLLPPKCIHRGSTEVNVSQGNHSVTGLAGETIMVSDPFILHFPYRELSRYKNKVSLGGAAYERNRDLPRRVGITWREHFAMLERNEIETFWRTLHIGTARLQDGLIAGRYLHCRRVSSILGLLDDEHKSQRIQGLVLDLVKNTIGFARQKRKAILAPITSRPQQSVAATLYHHNFPFALEGLNTQVQSVRRLLSEPNSYSQLQDQLAEIRDAFSLCPENPYFLAFLEGLLQVFCSNSFDRLREYCFGKRLLVHISCRKYMQRSIDSSATFQAMPDDYRRLVVVGDPAIETAEATQLGFDFQENILRLPVSDAYENLATKVFFVLFILSLVADPQLVVKLDDDLRLRDQQVFHKLIEESLVAGHSYVGYAVGSPHHRQWHGWHIHKCADKRLNHKGYQYPVAESYAAGGFGYILSRDALADCRYMFLTMRAFFEQHAVQLEDAYVSQALQMNGRPLKSIQIDRPIPIESAALPGLVRVVHEHQPRPRDDSRP